MSRALIAITALLGGAAVLPHAISSASTDYYPLDVEPVVLEAPDASEADANDAAPERITEAEPVKLPVFRGYEADWHQAHDAMIVAVVEEFNASYGWTGDHPQRLDPALVKAWALQESGGHHTVFTRGDMMQMNNNGDWAAEKEWFGVRRGQRLTPEQSLRAALKWAYYKGEETRPMRGGAPSDGWYRTVRGGEVLPGYESRFTSWQRALTRYNGGGVADYHGDISRRMSRST